MDWKLINTILFGKQPPGRMREGFDDLSPDGLTMGTLFIGRPGSGKTSSLARHVVDYFLRYPDRAIFVLDWGGSDSDSILTLISQLDEPARGKALKRIVYDELGNPDITIPMPEFSEKYGPYEEQVQRVGRNLEKSEKFLVERTPVVGGLALENAPHFFRVCTSITNENNEPWQITEAKKLAIDEGLLRLALKQFGYKAPESKYFLEKVFLPKKDSDKQLSVYALTSILGVIEPREIRARLGYYRPGWTPKEAIDKGMLVLINGARLINQEKAQHYLFTQVYSLIIQEINKRVPGDPIDKPVALVMDEVYTLLNISGMAEEIGKLSPLYRSRKLELYIVLQTLSQLAPTLREQIWSIGNVVCFAVSNFAEAYEIAQQIFKYEPKMVKLSPTTPDRQPVVEPDRGQYLSLANYIQRMNHRECIMRRYTSEKQLDSNIYHVTQTRSLPGNQPASPVWELKEQLLKERGVLVRDALEVINQRKLQVERRNPPQV
jgi:hypothetical protein